MPRLTPEIVEHARTLRAAGHGWRRIQTQIGVSEYILRVELEPGYREQKSGQHRAYIVEKKHIAAERAAARALLRLNTKDNPRAGRATTAFDRVPDDVLRERDARKTALDGRTVTQRLMGDPPVGWRALDQQARR
jgi:hypothetical protein